MKGGFGIATNMDLDLVVCWLVVDIYQGPWACPWLPS